MDIIAGISAAITAAKATGDYLEGNQDAQKKIIDLSLQLMDVHQKAMQLLQENGELQARLQELEAKQRIDDSVYFQNEACWRKDKDGQEKGPYCHVCWESERKLIHLNDMTDEFRTDWHCSFCNGSFWVK